MTKVQLTFTLSRPLTEKDFASISHVHAIYGIFAARILPSGNQLFVEYDSSRLSRKEVHEMLGENGIPVT